MYTILDNSGFAQSIDLSDTLNERDQSSVLTQSMGSLTVDCPNHCFQVPADTALFYPNNRRHFF